MDMKVHCPGCSKSLRVPKTSSGRKARCPSCRKVFLIPAPEELVDETISTWIEEDLEKLDAEHERQWEAIGSLKSYQRQAARPAVMVTEESGKRLHQNGDHPETPLVEAGAPAELPAASSHDSSTVAAIVDLPPTSPAQGTVEVAPTPVVPQPLAELAAAPRAGAGRGTAAADLLEQPYPTSLRVDPMHPHLIVVRCDQGGVCLAFDAGCLEHMGFRTSMPMRCAFSGEMERRKLFARPLAFIDRSAARIRSASDFNSKYTTTLLSGQSTRELIDVIGNIDALPKPFSFCVPYYGCNELSHSTLKCWTETRSDGGFTCFVIIPSGPTALHWLMNVNGTCGVEFAKLEHDISLLDNEAWRLLGDECRRRLAVWCPFNPMEHFQLYLSDADFGSRDKGLAGLVLTDQRLVYCKYHHRGSLDLSQPAKLIVRDATDFAQLAIENADGKTKLVKLYLHDVPVLLKALAHWKGIEVERTTAVAEAATS